jgi:hypothetical protein
MREVEPGGGQGSFSIQVNKMGRTSFRAAHFAYPKNQPVQFPL